MQPRWQQIEEIFHRALNQPPDRRTEFLQSECRETPELIPEIQALLDSFENEADFLEEPVFELGLEAIRQKSEKDIQGLKIDRFQIEQKIGSGGMGEVFKAIDTENNRSVALKFLSASFETDDSSRRRFIKEARAAAALDHPNIGRVFEIKEWDSSLFFVMEYIDGVTLDKYLEETESSFEELLDLMRQILKGAAFAHSNGVIHRDLKPGNIMVSADGQIKILDFGLAKITSHKKLFGQDTLDFTSRFSTKGLVIGTVSYMSPEQLRSESVDFQSDIFSLGIIFYELLTNRNPFAAPSQAETISATLSDEPPPLNLVALKMPKELETLVEKCLQKKKQDRFKSVDEILVELERIETDYRRQKAIRRYRIGAIVVILLIALGLALLYGFNG